MRRRAGTVFDVATSVEEHETRSSRTEARRALIFVAGTFTLAWMMWFAALQVAGGTFAPGHPRQFLTTLIFYIGIFAPAMVAIVITRIDHGTQSVTALLRRLVRLDVAPKWYVYAIAYMAGIKLASAIVYRIAFGSWPVRSDVPIALMIGATLLSALVMGQSGEEIGWRGFLLPRLSARFGLALSSLVVGVVWASWHLPLFFMPGTETNGQSFPLYLLQVTALSVALAWLYTKSTGSLFLTMLMHAAINNTKDIFPSGTRPPANPLNPGSSAMGWITAGVLWVVAGYLLILMHTRRRVAG
jgi:membrane protease YdiL (CAAX protease family)